MTSKTLYEEQKKLLKNKSKAHKHLKVNIQGTILDFYVASLEDLQKQCDKVMPHVANARVDRIRIAQVDSTNNEGKDLEYVENYNRSDYWETPETQCQAVRQTALKLPQPVFTQMQLDILNNNSRKEFKVEARFQNILMQFMVDDIEEFTSQCVSLTDQMLSGTRVDLILLKINGEELPKIYNRNDYWESTQEKCQQAKIALLGRILPKEIRKIEKIKSRYKHHLNLDLNSLKFNFYINNSEDLKYQCRALISHLGQSPKDKITITGIGTDPLSSYNRESDWKGHEEICQEINRLVYEPKSE